MTLSVQKALGDALYRLFTRNGLILIASAFVVTLLYQVGFSTLLLPVYEDLWTDMIAESPEFEEFFDDPGELFPLALDIPGSGALGIVVLSAVLWLILLAVSLRVFHSDETETIRAEYVLDNMAWVVVNLFVGGIIFVFLWTLGLLFLIIPGIFIYVVLIYFIAAVAIEDRSFINGMSRSWGVTKGQRFKVFLLFLVLWLVSFGVSIAFTMIGFFLILLSPVAAELVGLIGQSLLMIYFAATVALSYRQLTEEQPVEEPVEGDDPFDEFAPSDANTQW